HGAATSLGARQARSRLTGVSDRARCSTCSRRACQACRSTGVSDLRPPGILGCASSPAPRRTPRTPPSPARAPPSLPRHPRVADLCQSGSALLGPGLGLLGLGSLGLLGLGSLGLLGLGRCLARS